ncbi:MAG: hypothetical protein NVSMB17_06100 [Candidatus Dormibacteria bacterium]
MKRALPTVAVVAFLLGALAFALVAGPLWHVGNLSPAATARPAAAVAVPADKSAKLQAACDSFLKDFAGRLHSTPADVKTALRASIIDSIDQALKNGDLTADQAARAKTHVDAIKGCESIPGLGKHFRHGEGGGPRAHEGPGLDAITGAAASALGVTQADLRAAILAGKTLHDIAGTCVTRSDFDSKFRAALAASLQPRVTSGKITADQAKARVDEAATLASKLWDSSLKDAMGGLFGNHPE